MDPHESTRPHDEQDKRSLIAATMAIVAMTFFLWLQVVAPLVPAAV